MIEEARMRFKQLPRRVRLMVWLMVLCFVTSFLMFSYSVVLMSESSQSKVYVSSVNKAIQTIREFESRAQNYSWSGQEPNSTFVGHGLGFLKIHKAASTTAQNVFLRYGWGRNWTFALPHENNSFGYPNIISITETVTELNVLEPPPGKKFDILCHHVFYGRHAWSTVLPVGAARVGIIREPFAVFQSVVRYFKPQVIKEIKSDNPVVSFLKNPHRYDNRDIRWSFLNNRMAQEYGVPTEVITKRDFARLENYIYDVLDKDFLVVIVAEKFDESMVLIKRLLNWTLYDILYISKNRKTHLSGHDTRFNFVADRKTRALHQRFSTFDYILYSFFKKRLVLQLSKQERLDEEVEQFKNIRRRVSSFCFHSGALDLIYLSMYHGIPDVGGSTLTIEASEWNEEFDVSNQDCYLMHMDEIDLTQAIRRRQYGKATWTWG